MKKTTSESAVADETSVKCEAVENCIIPVDLVIKSSDGKRIGAHKKNLEQFCTGFPLADSVVHRIDDVVTLTETAETLLLLLKYTHYAQHDMTDFLYSSQDQLISLTAAADKYGNFFALQACATTLK
ncbi:hypothetical protein MPER_04953 [Moniliophthora perniciosa FA553]|nr:hypothetical protein MPER_04953 [Moniliophthora perniciosa FA553]